MAQSTRDTLDNLSRDLQDIAMDLSGLALQSDDPTELDQLVVRIRNAADDAAESWPGRWVGKARELLDSTTISDAEAALETVHRAHDERWPARMCDLCRPIAEALALFDETVEVD